MTPSTLILYIIAGGLLGMLGQSIRVIIGLRKMKARENIYEASRLFISLVIGFTAGALGLLGLYFEQSKLNELNLAVKDIILLLSIGYSGVDFIEGFFRAYLNPKKNLTRSPTYGTIESESQLTRNGNYPEGIVTVAANIQDSPKEVKIDYGLNVKIGAISAYAIEVIKDVLRNSDNYSARITSTARTPMDQARVMFNNLIGGAENVHRQKALYGINGDKVIEVFETAKSEGKSKATILKLMELKILELGPDNVSKHCADHSKLVVVDIAPGSIKNQQAFITKVNEDERIRRFFGPHNSNDPAYHLEIPNVTSDLAVKKV